MSKGMSVPDPRSHSGRQSVRGLLRPLEFGFFWSAARRHSTGGLLRRPS